MLDLEIEARKWMKANGVAVTTKRIITLTNLLIDVENESYNDGLFKPKW